MIASGTCCGLQGRQECSQHDDTSSRIVRNPTAAVDVLWHLLWILGAMLRGIGVHALLQHCSKVVLTDISSAVPAGHREGHPDPGAAEQEPHHH